jgi:hypothetical protein
MAFFIKNFESITASLIQRVAHGSTALTDFNVGSKTRTMLEAFAQELEAFYHQMFRGILEAIDTSLFNSFDFPPLPAIAASGQVTFSLVEADNPTIPLAPTANITIPAGFRVQVPVQDTATLIANSAPTGTTYEVVSSAVWQAGQNSVIATVACSQAGIVGNTTSGSITGILDSLPPVSGGVYKVNNSLPYVNGRNTEDQQSRKARFARYLQSLARGTKVAILDAALTAVVRDDNDTILETVAKVIVIEPYVEDGSLPVGHVDIYIYNGVGGTTQALVDACQKIIDGYIDENNNRISGYKAAGIIATVKAAIEQGVNFNIFVKMKNGFSLTEELKEQLKGAIVRYVLTLNPGDALVFNKIIELAMDVPGIYNVIIATPNGDVVPESSRHVITILGEISIATDDEFTITSETYTT